jgi:IMP dehydrogenase/GMP reductase
MKIDMDVKLDFSDILLIPKRSELASRSEVDLEREITFKHSDYKWKGIPIIVSNMDTTGTIEMARELQKYKVITCLHKYYKADDIPDDLDPNYFMISTGITDNDINKMDEIISKKQINFICIDVANGYSINFQNKVREIKNKYPNKILVAGNVVTNELVEELIMHCGVDIVKIGIGSGCLKYNTQVLMSDYSTKNIIDIKIGDEVINMNNKKVKVINVINSGVKQIVKLDINNNITYVTPDHRYWVYNKKMNIYEWISINQITDDMRLTFIKNNKLCYDDNDKIRIHYSGLDETYDITVDCPTHSFIANGYIVHNSVCTTRLQTGVGYPQFSAVVECADAAHGLGGHIISDGGIQNVGDFSKAYGAGADFIMCGSMFAGHDESAGELIEENGQKYKIFYGMSSSNAMNKYSGGVAHYRSAEGKCVKVKYKGSVNNTILNILGGIRSTMTYIGATKIKNIPRSASFIRVNNIVNKIYNGSEI